MMKFFNCDFLTFLFINKNEKFLNFSANIMDFLQFKIFVEYKKDSVLNFLLMSF